MTLPALSIELAAFFAELRHLVDEVYTAFPSRAAITMNAYLDNRAKRDAEMQRDLLPLLVYCGLTEEGPSKAIPLAATWTLSMASGHMLDAAQDEGAMSGVNDAAIALGAANIALSRLKADADTLLDILDALGRATALAASAQQAELEDKGAPTRNSYFARIAGKAATIIATGTWMGGRLATDDAQTLAMLKEFGLAQGMAIQIADDCEDLVADLMAGIFTLPVIEGLAKRGDRRLPQLEHFLAEEPINRGRAEEIVALLVDMGALASARQVADAYQAQAAAVFGALPGLAPYFAGHGST